MKMYECPFCLTLHDSHNGTGSDVSCCGEVGQVRPVYVHGRLEISKSKDGYFDFWQVGEYSASLISMTHEELIGLRGMIDDILKEGMQ